MKEKATNAVALLEQEEYEELLHWVRTIPDCYDSLEIGACLDAKKLGKTKEMINYIKNNSPNSSEFITFCCSLDSSIPKQFED